MIITVFGATGMVGSKIVRSALALGHTVRAFGRNITDMIDSDLRSTNLEVIKGSVFDAKDTYRAIIGVDAVISALGGSMVGGDKTRSLGIKTIVEQMEKAKVKRIVALGGMGSLDTGDGSYIMDRPGYPAVFLPVSREHLQAYLYLEASQLDWTFVCPPDIKNIAGTGSYTVAKTHLPVPNLRYINAGDLAAFMVKETADNEYLHLRVGISARL